MSGKRILMAVALVLLAGTIIGWGNWAGAAGTTTRVTTIVVKDMHCAACANKIAAKLYTVSGVVEVRADVKRNVTFVGPQEQKLPSPRALWEAVEAAGFQPVQLVGPAGRFTSKPAQ